MKKESKDVSALVRIYDLILWMIPTLDKFPRRQKFLLADRILLLVPTLCVGTCLWPLCGQQRKNRDGNARGSWGKIGGKFGMRVL